MSHDPDAFIDAINPAHYAGRACADIGERLSANGFQMLKYCWRSGKKDLETIELGKAVWYGDSEFKLLTSLGNAIPGIKTGPMIADLVAPDAFLETRLVDQSDFTKQVARRLWKGYGTAELAEIINIMATEGLRHAGA